MTIGENNPGFKFQKGYFTDFVDHQKVTLSLQKFMFKDKMMKEMKENKEKKETIITVQKKINKRYLSLNRLNLEKNKKKTLEVVDKNNLFKLKSYLIKNGVLD